MTGGSELGDSTVSKALPADFVSVPEPIRVFGEVLLQAWKWLTRHSRSVITRGVSRRLRVAETVSLGEKRFVSILQVDGEQFLVGGSQSNIVLLAKLEAKPQPLEAGSFESVLTRANSDARESETGSDTSSKVAR